jgi:hypothetical protein
MFEGKILHYSNQKKKHWRKKNMRLNSKIFALKVWKFLPNSENHKIEQNRKMWLK